MGVLKPSQNSSWRLKSSYCSGTPLWPKISEGRKGIRVTRVWPQEPIPHQGPQSRGGQRQLQRKSTVPSVKPGGIRPVLPGAPSRNTGAPEVTQSGQGNQEDLPGTGSRDGGQVWGHEKSLEKQVKDRQKGVFPEPQLAETHRKTLTSKRQWGSLQGQPVHSHCSTACQPGTRSSWGTTRKAKLDSARALLRNLGRGTCQETTTVTELKCWPVSDLDVC